MLIDYLFRPRRAQQQFVQPTQHSHGHPRIVPQLQSGTGSPV